MRQHFDYYSRITPSQNDVRLAAAAYGRLEALLAGRRVAEPLRLQSADGGDELVLPLSAARMLHAMLRELACWNVLALVGVEAELTTQRAAELLNVSRPTAARLLDRGEIPSRRVGRHRRVRLSDVLDYKRRIAEGRAKAKKPAPPSISPAGRADEAAAVPAREPGG